MKWLRLFSFKSASSTATRFADRIAHLSEEEEIELVNRILVAGYDQGCFLRPDPSHLLSHTPEDLEDVFRALDNRNIGASPTKPDPFGDEGISVGEIAGREPGWIVITQRCDLIRSLRDEPFIELARSTFETDKNRVESAKKNSSRLLFVTAAGEGAWIADLRLRALLAKDQLVATPALNPVPVGIDRRRLKLRIGQRYSRDALPEDLVEKLQRPILKTLKKAAAREASEIFTEWLVFRTDDKVAVQALFDSDTTSQADADDAYDLIEKAAGPDVQALIAEEGSGAVALQQMNFWRYFNGFKMDLDEVSYWSKASPDAAKPSL